MKAWQGNPELPSLRGHAHAMRFQIYTMYVNRKDLLVQAIESVGAYAGKVVVLDNSRDQNLTLDGFQGEIVRPPSPLYCSDSYNLILARAVKRRQQAFFIMHSDALASEDVIRQMLARAEELSREGKRWGVMFSNYDVLCLQNTQMLKGFAWDTNLPLYYTDVDFYYRLKLAGIDIVETRLPVTHQEGGSASVVADAAICSFVNSNWSRWRDYYMRKWGGDRDHEHYTVPFNGEDVASA